MQHQDVWCDDPTAAAVLRSWVCSLPSGAPGLTMVSRVSRLQTEGTRLVLTSRSPVIVAAGCRRNHVVTEERRGAPPCFCFDPPAPVFCIFIFRRGAVLAASLAADLSALVGLRGCEMTHRRAHLGPRGPFSQLLPSHGFYCFFSALPPTLYSLAPLLFFFLPHEGRISGFLPVSPGI